MSDQSKINDIQQEINEKVSASLLVANHEMGGIKNELSEVKNDIAEIKVHISWVKGTYKEMKVQFDKLDNRVWAILFTIIVGFLISIYMK